MIYQWIDRNREHIAKHNVAPSEAEFIIDRARPPFPREVEDSKQLVWGQTLDGRFLQVIFVYLADDEVDFAALSPLDRLRFEAGTDVALVVHARDLTRTEKRQYRRVTR